MRHAVGCLAVAMAIGCGGRTLESGSDGVPAGTETAPTPTAPVPEATDSVRGRVATYGPAGEGIALYPADLSASTRPLTTLDGAWQANACQALSFDSAGNLYALCYQAVPSEPPSQVDVFTPNAMGSAAPTRVITGAETTLSEAAINLAVDGPGNVYVVQDGYCQLASTCVGMVSVFAPGANGNVAPMRVIQGPHTGLDYSAAIAVDAAGQIYVGNAEGGPILVFSADAHDDAKPIRRIGRAQDIGDVTSLAVDASGTVYVSDVVTALGVLVYGPSAAEGDAPARVIAGPATGIEGGLGVAVDSAGQLLVADDSHDVSGLFGTVSIFAPGASGNVAPNTVLSGIAGFGLAIAP